MGVTLDGVDIETISNVRRIHRPKLNNFGLGIHSLQISQMMKSMVHQYQITGVWTNGDTDYDNKERKVQNIMEAGLPVWLDATAWRKNALMFGRVHEFLCEEDEGSVNVSRFSFLVTGVMPWGYIFVQDPTTGIVIYDLNKQVQSVTIYPILRQCNFAKSGSAITYSIYVKNQTAGTVSVVLELMVADEVNSGNVAAKITASAGWSKAANNVGTSGFSSTPGTKVRVTLTKSFTTGTEEQLDITINYSSAKTSFVDGSIDDISPF
jgi:hypothetical protein